MRMPLVALAVALAALAGLAAADAKPKVPKGGGNIGGSGSADAEAAFRRQAGQATPATAAWPQIVGAYVWGGRADEEYRPFFQWELRLQGGTAALAGLRARAQPLNPDRTPASTGPWKPLDALPAGARRDVSLKLNCAAFSGYRIDLEWEGGKASYIAVDKLNLPVCLADVANQPYLMATAYMHDPDAKKKPWTCSWWLWNLGGVEATDTVQTVSLYDQGQKVLTTVEVRTGTVKAGVAVECTASLPQPPAGYVSIGVAARCADVAAGVAADPGFTGAKELEVAHVRLDGDQLRARVRNGYDRRLEAVAVTLTLLDAGGKAIRAVAMPAVDLAPGSEADLAAPHGGVKAFAGWETGWTMAKPGAPAAAPAGEAPPLVVQGLEFRQRAAVRDGGTLWLKGDLANRSGRALAALAVTFVATGGGRTVEVPFRQESLAADGSVVVALEAPGLAAIERLEMRWTAK